MELFKKKVQLYKGLPPKERIENFLLNHVYNELISHGFKYLKSAKTLRKVNSFFNYEISWHGSKFNNTDDIVSFELVLSVKSPKYYSWEKKFYLLQNQYINAIAGSNILELDDCDKSYSDGSKYDLVKYDNQKVASVITKNITTAGLSFFENFNSIPGAIKYLSKYPIANFENIVDFYLIEGKKKEAQNFFEKNCKWFLEQDKLEGDDPNSDYSLNRKESFELRRKALACKL